MKDKIKISFNIPIVINDRLEKLAQEAEIDKTRLMINILDQASQSLEATGKVGVLQFALLIRNLGEQLQKWAKTVKAKKVEPL